MSHSRGPSLVSPAPTVSKQSEPPRLRKRLQKKFPSIRRPAPIDPSASNKLNSAVGLVAQQAGTIGQPSLRLSPDLSDAKWREYLSTSGVAQDSTGQPRTSFEASATPRTPAPAIIPEFSHLAISNSKSRPSLDSATSSPASSISTRSSMRRRAKTPVYAIGQLDAPPCGRDPSTADKVSSVDLIAQQYQALIESQDSNSIYTDTRSDPLPSRQSSYDRLSLVPSRYSAQELRPDVYLPPPPRCRPDALTNSPTTSDDGTLVAFDEEAIYFKPMSFSPEPPSPPPRNRARVQRDAVARATVESSSCSDHNLGLQICTHLLVRELSAAMVERPQGSGEDISSLQIWVMIEAYERLRDQVMESQNSSMRVLEPVFDTWLSALYSLHEKLTNDANSLQSHYDVAGLETEDVD